ADPDGQAQAGLQSIQVPDVHARLTAYRHNEQGTLLGDDSNANISAGHSGHFTTGKRGSTSARRTDHGLHESRLRSAVRYVRPEGTGNHRAGADRFNNVLLQPA